MKKYRNMVYGFLIAWGIFSVCSNSTFAFSFSPPPDGLTGSPADNFLTCNSIGCHNTFGLNSGNAKFSISSPDNYTLGEVLNITISFDNSPPKHGFELSALDANNNHVGAFSPVDSNTQTVDGNYIKQTTAGSDLPGNVSWTVDWTAPASEVIDPITFYACGVEANADFSPLNDQVYTVQRNITRASIPTPTPVISPTPEPTVSPTTTPVATPSPEPTVSPTASPIATPTPRLCNLEAHYAFDEGIGNIAGDSSGNGNDGTISGADWTTGKIGGGLRFDGIDDKVSVPVVNNEEMSISAWFFRNEVDGKKTDGIFGGKRWNEDLQLREGFDLRFRKQWPNSLKFILITQDGSGNRIQRTCRAFLGDSTNRWFHVVGTYDKTTGNQKLYINGKLKSTRMHPAGNAVVPLTFFANATIGLSGPTGYFNGIIDDVRLYCRPLNFQEVKDLFESGN